VFRRFDVRRSLAHPVAVGVVDPDASRPCSPEPLPTVVPPVISQAH